MSERNILIIGAGFSGICLGIQLKRAGIHSFTILEKAERLGGTWRDNAYPGAACDVPSMSYCFSFHQKTDWSRKWSPQAEILEYMEQCAEKYGLTPHIRFGCEVVRARFDADTGIWTLETRDGEELDGAVLASGVGQLSRPRIPDLHGMADFEGESFHSAHWNHACALEDRSIGVIGNAASAIQFVPQIAKRAARVIVFQRSANWMMPRGDRAYSETEKRRLTRHPWLARLYRWWIWAAFESQFPIFAGRAGFWSRYAARKSTQLMRAQIDDPALQEALIPDYPFGGKRILISDDYYAALARDNVDVVTSRIDHLSRNAVATSDGRDHRVDTVIFATGFQTTSFLAPMEIRGLGGRSLDTEWKDGAEAYLGISVASFPNFFMMYGPNTNLGHNSIIFMIECQVGYIVRCIQEIFGRDLKYLDLRQNAMDAFNARLQRELRRTAWAATDHSWYKTEDGKITNNWSGTTTRYWWLTRRVDFERYLRQTR